MAIHDIPKTGMGKPDTATLRRLVTGQARAVREFERQQQQGVAPPRGSFTIAG